MEDYTIKAENISKKYRIGETINRRATLTAKIFDTIISPFMNFKKISSLTDLSENEGSVITALEDISFELKKGDTLGIIGKNGAGKSTLLKILSRITEPTSGRAIINGRIGSLLEVGTGFHPELTGRENIFLSGSILGMKKKEIESKFDEIVEFSEVTKFLDTPLKRYSSGMKVRLGFSVAAHLEPEIMIIDEVLAVGDIFFQEKCLRKIKDLRKKGLTILFVSHNMAAIQNVCKDAILLDNGKMFAKDSALETIDKYRDLINKKSDNSSLRQNPEKSNEKISIIDFKIFNANNEEIKEIKFNSEITIKIKIFAREKIEFPVFNFGLLRGDGVNVCNFNNFFDNFKIDYVEGAFQLTGYLPPLRLIPDYYEPWILVWPWKTIHNSGEINSLNPFTYKIYPPVKFSGINLFEQDGIIQLPSKKWILESNERIIEHEANSNSIFEVLGSK